MTTIAQARDAILARLIGETPRRLTTTNGVVTTTATSVTLSSALVAAQTGSLLELGQELVYITDPSSAPSYDMIRAMYGTTAVQHSSGILAEVNPRFRAMEVTSVIAEELRSWPVQLGRMETVETEVPAQQYQATLDPTTTGEVHRLVSADVLGVSTRDWDQQRSRIDVRLIYDRDTNQFTTGWGIQLPQRFDTVRTIQTTLITDYDLSSIGTDGTDLEGDVGLRANRLDVLYYGVMWRLMSWKEVGRTDRASNAALDSEEVPPTHQIQVAQQLKQLRDQRLSEEVTRMYDLYPVLMSTQ